MSPRTIQQIRDDYASSWSPPSRRRATILDPNAGECEPMFTSSRLDDCLTHLTRFIIDFPEWSFTTESGRVIQHDAYQDAHGWCGTRMMPRQIPVGESTGFVCAACIATAEKYGEPTFGTIPDTGCTVSGGKRGRKTPAEKTRR